MPPWLSIAIGMLLGVAVIFGAIYLAIRPYVQVKPPKPLMPDPTEGAKDWGASNGWNGPEGGGLNMRPRCAVDRQRGLLTACDERNGE
jgi:hypothetical protein